MHNLRGTPRLCHSAYVDVPTNSEGSTLKPHYDYRRVWGCAFPGEHHGGQMTRIERP